MVVAMTQALVRREDAVLVLIDIQGRLAAAMERRDEVVSAAIMLVKVAALVGMPVIVTRQYPEGLGGTVDELEAAVVASSSAGANIQGIDKTAFCCAAEPDFGRALSATGRSQVVVAGMETHICVAQTVLALLEDGRDVQVAADACCSRSAGDHDIALARMRAAGAQVTTVESVMYEAVGVAGTPEFKRLLAIVKGDE